MVRTRHCKRFAFTMIELIFAIVIIAISVLSLPIMIGVINKGVENSLAQEAIFAASAELMGSSAGYWDENSMEDIDVSHLSRVIDIANICDSDRLRPGHIAQMYHRRCLDNPGAITGVHNSSINLVDINVSDLNNVAHPDESIFTDNTTDAAGYKQTYTSSIIVSLGADTNIKEIVATIRDEDGDIVTILRSQSANIGEIDYYKRMF